MLEQSFDIITATPIFLIRSLLPCATWRQNGMNNIKGTVSDLQPDDPKRHIRVISGRKIFFDDEGFFWYPEEWSEDVAIILARESGLEEISERHWQVIRFLRAYFFDQGRSPLNRQLTAGVGMSLMALESLFPGGIKNGARRLAGLPNPKGCAD